MRWSCASKSRTAHVATDMTRLESTSGQCAARRGIDNIDRMGLYLENLNDKTRQHMLAELEYDLENERLYYSKWFTAEGKLRYPDLCRDAIASGSDDTLAASLSAPEIFAERYEKRTPSGGATTAAVPRTAPATFSEGEFNRFYLRGLCAHLLESGGGRLEIYRARESARPRPASEALIGSILDPDTLLADLRGNVGVDTALGLPPGPNSGLSGRIASDSDAR